MPKQPTKWEIAKPILEKMYLMGEITDSMRRGVVHKLRPEFEAVPINNFGNNWNRLKATVRELRRRAIIDDCSLFHDRILHPIDTTDPKRWDGTEAQRLLKQDIEDDFHKHFTPKELWLSRKEYQVFDIEIFQPHVNQEVRSKLETNYWLVKKEKKKRKLMPKEDDVEYYKDATLWADESLLD